MLARFGTILGFVLFIGRGLLHRQLRFHPSDVDLEENALCVGFGLLLFLFDLAFLIISRLFRHYSVDVHNCFVGLHDGLLRDEEADFFFLFGAKSLQGIFGLD